MLRLVGVNMCHIRRRTHVLLRLVGVNMLYYVILVYNVIYTTGNAGYWALKDGADNLSVKVFQRHKRLL